jgi:hypothetical protein
VTPPRVGDLVERGGATWRVTDVAPRLTPYRRRGQDTRVEGWTLGLVRLTPLEELLAMPDEMFEEEAT